jgi:adenosylcobinamide kinase/adenosylcobinamide-phosphate guanylyltransferase
VLVLGGISSGKSAYAEKRALDLSGRARPIYIATADAAHSAADPEMMARIRRHRARRGNRWRLVEAPSDLAAALDAAAARNAAILVDCLTLWLGNRLAAEANLAAEEKRLLAALKRTRAPVVLVSGEAGLGGIAENALARRFADAQGALNQAIGRIATEVVLVAAGMPLVLKPQPKSQQG